MSKLNKSLCIFIIFLGLFTSSQIFSKEEKVLEKDWIINPFGDDNPIFEGGWELFASSRVGQVYLPGAGVTILSPFYTIAGQTMAPRLSHALSSVTSEYIAHVSWRLGCDQGYLAAKELKRNNYTSVYSYLMGSTSPDNPHPILAHNLDQTITPTALLLFGLGQVIGQRYFGNTLVTKTLKQSEFFNKKMGKVSSIALYDRFGWPVTYGETVARSEVVGKMSGILLGTYLGWSLNDFGWQLANWRKFSTDSFSEYMPYYGNPEFGSINKGWGILGFTVGGFLGHNIGATIGDRLASKSKLYPKAWFGTPIKHFSAIAGNLGLGLTLTTYFPHLFRKVFGFYKPLEIKIPYEGLEIHELGPEEQENLIKDVISVSLDEGYNDLLRKHHLALMEMNGDLKKIDLSEEKQDPESELFNFKAPFESIISPTFKALMSELSKDMEKRIYRFFYLVKDEMNKIENLEDLHLWIRKELLTLIPEDFLFSKEIFLESLISSIDNPQELDHYKKRITSFVLYLYPVYYKYKFAETIESLYKQQEFEHGDLFSLLLIKKNFLLVQIAKLFENDPEKAEEIRVKFQDIHARLILKDPSKYSKKTLTDYIKSLDDLNDEISGSMP